MACSSLNFTGVTLWLGIASSYFDLLRAAGGGGGGGGEIFRTRPDRP